MRRRLTRRNRIAAAPPALPGYDTNTDPDVDEYGIDSDFGSEPHPGPYLSGPPPATPGYSKSARQIRASMERKAAKCIRIAQAMLGREASTAEIEDQALDLMDLSDRQIQASLARIAESFMMAEEFEAGQNDPFHNIRAEEEHEAMGMYGGVHEGMYEDDDMLLEMMAEDDHEAMYEDDMLEMMAEDDHEAMYEDDMLEMMAEEDLMLEMMAEEDLLEAMMEEEAMGKYAKEDSEEAEEEEEAKEEKKASLDPMGLNVGDEDYALAELFSDRLAKKKAEEDEDDDDDDDDDDDESDDSMEASKKAYLRPQNRKPSNGVRSLGTMSKAASSEVSELSSLWKNAPDVSKYFG